MKSKLIILAVVLIAAAGGYWFGSYRTAQIWNHIVEGQLRSHGQTETKYRAQKNLKLLNYLHEGKQSEAIKILERQLDVAVIRCAASWNSAPQNERDGSDIWIIRDTRDYRSRHPWTNDNPEIFENVQKTFKLAD